MTITPNASTPAPLFTPRLIDGSLRAPRVVFLDPIAEIPESVVDRVTHTISRDGEIVFAISRHAIYEGYRRLGKICPSLALPEYGAPDLIQTFAHPVHAVFAATLSPPFETGLVQSYALSNSSPTVGFGIKAHQWLADLGADTSNRLLWSGNAS